MRNCRPVLLVEDDDVDAMIVRRAMKDLNVINPLVHTLNGEEALAHLVNNDNEKPCVILLDLNTPVMNGIEFLRAIKADEKLRRTPVIVLTTSLDTKDKVDTFELSVAGYIVKPVDYKEFTEVIKTVHHYWTTSELPNGE